MAYYCWSCQNEQIFDVKVGVKVGRRDSCPHCGAEVYEEAEQCPRCGEYLIRSTHPFQGRSLTWIILGLLGIVAVLISMFTWLPGM